MFGFEIAFLHFDILCFKIFTGDEAAGVDADVKIDDQPDFEHDLFEDGEQDMGSKPENDRDIPILPVPEPISATPGLACGLSDDQEDYGEELNVLFGNDENHTDSKPQIEPIIENPSYLESSQGCNKGGSCSRADSGKNLLI